MQSHMTLPLGVRIRIARWPMPTLGVVVREMKRSSVGKVSWLLT
jgi:hypothetical protein